MCGAACALSATPSARGWHHSTMVLRIDPRLPLVWRSPSSLQLGVDAPPVTLVDVSEAQERMISALVAGITRPGLNMLAAVAGADDGAVDRLLRLLKPALLGSAPPLGPRTVVIAGRGNAVERIADALASDGVEPRLVGGDLAAARNARDIAAVVGHFVLDPAFHGLWLRRDLPHLPIVFGDTGAQIGPFIEPGHGPCLHCLERWHTDADPSWPAMASQLLGRRSPVDAGIVAGEVAAIAARMLLARLVGGPAPTAVSVRLDAGTGATAPTVWRRHPECGCAALPGTGTADAASTFSARPRRTTGAAAPAHA
jgi:bacteriocin biosynthesis cyclodehydratase domain-containing protein